MDLNEATAKAKELSGQGLRAGEIAKWLTKQGFNPPQGRVTAQFVGRLISSKLSVKGETKFTKAKRGRRKGAAKTAPVEVTKRIYGNKISNTAESKVRAAVTILQSEGISAFDRADIAMRVLESVTAAKA